VRPPTVCIATPVEEASPARSEGLHQRLREATSALHRRVEENLDLLSPDLTVERYRAVLGLFYGYYEPLEARLDAAATTAPPRGFALVARAPRIQSDLVAVGASPEDVAKLPRCPDLPRVTLPTDVAGCLYVLEGASLGGQVISRGLERRLGIVRSNGGSFFAGDGPRTASRWMAVLGWIDELARAHDGGDAIVEAACETFRTLAHWLERPMREP
jgi:heme oxygenase (biliverdin-IX-beta and delta-forming)